MQDFLGRTRLLWFTSGCCCGDCCCGPAAATVTFLTAPSLCWGAARPITCCGWFWRGGASSPCGITIRLLILLVHNVWGITFLNVFLAAFTSIFFAVFFFFTSSSSFYLLTVWSLITKSNFLTSLSQFLAVGERSEGKLWQKTNNSDPALKRSESIHPSLSLNETLSRYHSPAWCADRLMQLNRKSRAACRMLSSIIPSAAPHPLPPPRCFCEHFIHSYRQP